MIHLQSLLDDAKCYREALEKEKILFNHLSFMIILLFDGGH